MRSFWLCRIAQNSHYGALLLLPDDRLNGYCAVRCAVQFMCSHRCHSQDFSVMREMVNEPSHAKLLHGCTAD